MDRLWDISDINDNKSLHQSVNF